MKKKILASLVVLALSVVVASVNADPVTDLQTAWGEANYVLQGKDQLAAYDELLAAAEKAKTENPKDAGVYIWSGIVHSSFAGVKGGLGALKFAKLAKSDLENAMAIDANALEGSAYASLGTLYYKVPGWPVSFGNKDKAKELLSKALMINPEGIDSNYFYADYMFAQGNYDEAWKYAQKAKAAPARPFREIADHGRHAEIDQLMEKIEQKRD